MRSAKLYNGCSDTNQGTVRSNGRERNARDVFRHTIITGRHNMHARMNTAPAATTDGRVSNTVATEATIHNHHAHENEAKSLKGARGR